MSCSLLGAWRFTWADVWSALERDPRKQVELFGDLVSGVVPVPVAPIAPVIPANALDDEGNLMDASLIILREGYEAAYATYQFDSRNYLDAETTEKSKSYFKKYLSKVRTEIEAIRYIEDAYKCLDDIHAARLKMLFKNFLNDRNIAYEIFEPFDLRPNILGLFARLRQQTQTLAKANPRVAEHWNDFEEAFSDMKNDQTPSRMRTCLQKQFIFVEAFTQSHPNVSSNTFGQMCAQLDWPHPTLRNVASTLYGFRSDFPGLGHAGNPDAVIRPINMKDFVSLSLMLFSLTPYLSNDVDLEVCYRGVA